MELPVVNHPDYVAKINEDNKFPIQKFGALAEHLLKTKVIRPKITETTALGAAFFSGLSTEFWPSINSINDMWEEDQSFVPKLSDSKSNIISMWEKRVLKVLS